MKKAPKISKNMGSIQKVGQYDPNFQRFLREYGHKNVGKILSSPSSMKKAYVLPGTYIYTCVLNSIFVGIFNDT